MADFTESKLFKEYSRVALSADALGLTFEDIQSLMIKIENDLEAASYFRDSSSRQVALKAILVRLGLERDDFFKYLNQRKNNLASDETLQLESGLRNLKVYKAILK